jgi:Protein of unknown function (DUF3160)
MFVASRFSWFGAFAVLPIVACASQSDGPRHGLSGAGSAEPLAAAAPKRYSSTGVPPEKTIIDRYLAAHPNLTADQVLAMVPKRPYVEALSFDPSTAAYYKEVTDALQLTDQERNQLRRNGFVSVDHRRHYSMGSMYFDIYVRDLPVLITTDSIAHALHRSYDDTLKTLEIRLFSGMLDRLLTSTHEVLEKEAAGLTDPALLESVKDIDLYVTVARSLLAGMGAPRGEPLPPGSASPPTAIASRFGQDKQVLELLERVVSLEMETPDTKTTAIYGGRRPIDWSQFKPRGHYTESSSLKYYFRMMMWLGRADIGWNLSQPAENSGLVSNAARERTNAAMFSYILEKTGQMPRLTAMSKIIDFLVGKGDSLSVDTLQPVIQQLQVKRLADFGNADVAQRLESAVKQLGLGQQRIASQVLVSDPNDSKKTMPPQIFQVFGQRFIIDSFVLGQIVYDSIVYNGKKQERGMPQAIDVFAALGNDEALRLAEPELRRWNYGSNLMATRAVIESYTPKNWSESAYNTWLDALRSLDDAFPAASKAPQAMRTRAWQHKELETQLASWAELRHDTILYAKQSYSTVVACEYPAGYVEPYPRFYERLGDLGREMARLLAGVDVTDPDSAKAEQDAEIRQSMVTFWNGFALTMKQLQTLAQKELAAQPFTAEERAFIKKTIDIRGGGSGPPRYDGWYPKLVYGGNPEKWKPTVADVHTDPTAAEVLQVGVGDVTFLVAAIDNENDKMVYVGPMSSYYEFRQPVTNRMADEEWRAKVERFEFPPRPAWASSVHPTLTSPSTSRSLGPPPPRPPSE